MSLHEIVLPETKPETEWVRGRALQKVSPTGTHAEMQGRLLIALTAWNDDSHHGRVGIEWRFRVAPPGEAIRPLVPDVSFISYEALAADAPLADVDVPLAAPTVAFEILSRGDRRIDVDDKIATYLAAGSSAVVLVDPRRRVVEVHDRRGATALSAAESFAHPALPGFALELGPYFARLDRL